MRNSLSPTLLAFLPSALVCRDFKGYASSSFSPSLKAGKRSTYLDLGLLADHGVLLPLYEVPHSMWPKLLYQPTSVPFWFDAKPDQFYEPLASLPHLLILTWHIQWPMGATVW